MRRGDRALHAGSHDGEWRLQLVARVRSEAVQRGEAALQPAHHLVERHGEPPQLVPLHRYRQPPVQTAPVADLADLFDDPIDRGQRPARDEAAHEDRQGEAGHEDQEECREQLLRPELGARDVRPGEQRADLRPGVAQRQDYVMQRRAVRVDAQRAGGAPGARRMHQAPQLLELAEGERLCVGGRAQHAVAASSCDNVGCCPGRRWTTTPPARYTPVRMPAVRSASEAMR